MNQAGAANNGNSRTDVIVEACVGSLDGALIAQQAGADRIELNLALELDGLTPSPGLVSLVSQAVRIPIITMARPRAGDFFYTESEWETLLADATWQLENGADGIAFGCLDSNGQVDQDRCRQMRSLSGTHEVVFHKAFDEVADWASGLEILIESGINRVMTSGQQPTAMAGIETLSAIFELADGRIEVLPAGGVGSVNALKILEKTGCNQIHGSFSSGADGDVLNEICRTVDLIRSRFGPVS